MKRIILSLAVLFSIGTTVALATEDRETNPKALETFKREFSNAEFVKWSVENEFTKVSFVLGGNRAVAIFNADGELVGSMRDLLYNQLPLSVMSAVEKRFEQSSTIDIREVSNNDGTSYHITLEQKEKKYKVVVFPDGTFSSINKSRI
jgi:hypothetical protein